MKTKNRKKAAINYSVKNPNSRLVGLPNREPKKKINMVWKSLEEGKRPVLVPLEQQKEGNVK